MLNRNETQTETALDPKRRYLCRHVHTGGNRCGSPALRGQHFCYYHDRTSLPNAPLAGRIGIFKMQPIDDRGAIQIALYDVLSRITAGDLDTKRASILLYGLQIASSNLARQEKLQPATNLVESIKYDQRLGDLAPVQEIPNPETAAESASAKSADLSHAPAYEIQTGHPEAKPKDLSSSDIAESESSPTTPEPRHSEPQAQNLCISPITEPQSAPHNLVPACITLAAVQATAVPPCSSQRCARTRPRNPTTTKVAGKSAQKKSPSSAANAQIASIFARALWKTATHASACCELRLHSRTFD